MREPWKDWCSVDKTLAASLPLFPLLLLSLLLFFSHFPSILPSFIRHSILLTSFPFLSISLASFLLPLFYFYSLFQLLPLSILSTVQFLNCNLTVFPFFCVLPSLFPVFFHQTPSPPTLYPFSLTNTSRLSLASANERMFYLPTLSHANHIGCIRRY